MTSNYKYSAPVLWYIVPLLYSLYYFQGVVYSRGPISLISITLLLLIGAYCCARTFFMDKTRPRPLIIILVLVLLITFSYLISPKYVISRNSLFPLGTFGHYKEFMVFFLAIFTGYQTGLKGSLRGKQLIICCFVFFALAVLQFYRISATLAEEFHRDEVTNNSAYFFVAVMPFFILLLKKKKILGWLLIAVSVCAITYTFKRGAIIVSAIILLYISLAGGSKNKISLKGVLFAAIIMGIAVAFFLHFMESSEYMTQRVMDTMEGNSSARDRLYTDLWEKWLNSDLFHQIFGYGISQTVTYADNYAHNDWLEILIDFGLLGAFLYASILISLFRYRRYLGYDKWSKICYTSIMLIWVMKTLFSMGIGIPEGTTIMLLGSLIGDSVRHRKRSLGLAPYGTNESPKVNGIPSL